MNWQVKIAKRTSKQMRKFPRKDFERILTVFEEMGKNPFQGDIVKIEGETNTWRCRVGNYRILFEIFINERIASIYNVERKTTTTYRNRKK